MAKALWYYSDDYYFSHIEKKEINIKIQSDGKIWLWVYDHLNNQNLCDKVYHSLDEVEESLQSIFHRFINTPTFSQLSSLQGSRAFSNI
ncbi:MAG: hypothetical protein IE909_01415 [Campylobacterales bacterium]|nr:hypothetical protein [Campylobacterales bacterium]